MTHTAPKHFGHQPHSQNIKCVWRRAHTDIDTGRQIMLPACRAMGCLGEFWKHEPIPEPFNRCFLAEKGKRTLEEKKVDK
jgi:hypothetical protein